MPTVLKGHRRRARVWLDYQVQKIWFESSDAVRVSTRVYLFNGQCAPHYYYDVRDYGATLNKKKMYKLRLKHYAQNLCN